MSNDVTHADLISRKAFLKDKICNENLDDFRFVVERIQDMQIPVGETVFMKDGEILFMIKKGINKAKKAAIRAEKQRDLDIQELQKMAESNEGHETMFSVESNQNTPRASQFVDGFAT